METTKSEYMKSFRHSLENGLIKFDNVDFYKFLNNECSDFPSRNHDDMIDALGYALYQVNPYVPWYKKVWNWVVKKLKSIFLKQFI